MRLSFVLSLMPLAGFVGALHVTEPEKGADIKASDSLTVKWTYVDTDAKSFNLYLVNNAVYPPISNKIASDVKTSDGSYTIDSLTGVSAGQGYQINLQSDVSLNTGILAQSEQFNVTGSAQSSSSSTSSSSISSGTTTASGTTTGTATTNTSITSTTPTGAATGSKTTGTSGSTGAASSTGASASASGTSSQTAVPSTGAAAALVAHPAAAAGLLAGALAFGM